MKKIIILSVLFLLNSWAFAQMKNPVKWTTKTVKVSDTEFDLVVKGSIEPEWHVYSQFTPDGGSLPMVLNFKDAKNNYQLIGKAKESAYKKQFNDIFGVDEYYFDGQVTLTQRVKILNAKLSKITLNLDYQACKEQCINDNKTFVFDIPKINQELLPVTDATKTTAIRSLLNKGQKEKAMEIFKYNAKSHPEEKFTPSVGLARGYTAIGDKKNVIKYWELAIKNIPADQKQFQPQYEAELKKLKEGK